MNMYFPSTISILQLSTTTLRPTHCPPWYLLKSLGIPVNKAREARIGTIWISSTVKNLFLQV